MQPKVEAAFPDAHELWIGDLSSRATFGVDAREIARHVLAAVRHARAHESSLEEILPRHLDVAQARSRTHVGDRVTQGCAALDLIHDRECVARSVGNRTEERHEIDARTRSATRLMDHRRSARGIDPDGEPRGVTERDLLDRRQVVHARERPEGSG